MEDNEKENGCLTVACVFRLVNLENNDFAFNIIILLRRRTLSGF
jgi:hypothetical protein